MKKIIIIGLLLLISSKLKAEYNGYHIKFLIKEVSGKKSIGYLYVAAVYLDLDSLKKSEYLKSRLSWQYRFEDSLNFTYFKDRVVYHYSNVWDSSGTTYPIYEAINKTKLPLTSIKEITIIDMIDQTYMIGIATELNLSDTTWMKKKPLKRVQISGYLCSFQIFIHDNSPKVNEIIKELEMSQMVEASENEDVGEDVNQVVEPRKITDDDMDDFLFKIIKKLNKYKVITISECSF